MVIYLNFERSYYEMLSFESCRLSPSLKLCNKAGGIANGEIFIQTRELPNLINLSTYAEKSRVKVLQIELFR